MQRYNYCNLIINYLVTNLINKIFKVILKQTKQAKNKQNALPKTTKNLFDTFLLYKYSIYEYFHSYLVSCACYKNEKSIHLT